MVTACCDTSFLYSLYSRDAHSARARTILQQIAAPLTLSPLNEYELSNAVRLAIFRKILTPGLGGVILDDFASDKESGRLVAATCNLAEVIRLATNLSADHTPKSGHRAFDILHVAASIAMKGDVFLTFDKNQRTLANAAGLKTKS